jgi:hypothetical protein
MALMAKMHSEKATDVGGDGDETPRNSGHVPSHSASRPTRAACSRRAVDTSAAVAEGCRAAAKVEVLKSMKTSALTAAAARLREPLDELHGLDGLPREMVRRCAVTIRGQEALARVPEALKREWSTGALQKWTEHAMKADFRDATGARSRRLARKKHGGSPGGKPVSQPPSPAHASSPTSLVAPLNPTKQALDLLEKWIRALRPIVPCGTMQATIINLVHGGEVELPPDPVGSELRRIVPQPNEAKADSTWVVFLEDLEAALDLEKQFSLGSVMHAEIPAEVRRKMRPCSAGAVSRHDRGSETAGKLLMRFPQAFKNIGGGGMRITASEMQPWSAGQMPRSPRTCEVPGPGFYVDRSLQRAICNPANGEFASAGKLRTCCPVNTMSITTRFGEVDICRAGPLGRPSSAPCLKGRASGEPADSTWGRLLTV